MLKAKIMRENSAADVKLKAKRKAAENEAKAAAAAGERRTMQEQQQQQREYMMQQVPPGYYSRQAVLDRVGMGSVGHAALKWLLAGCGGARDVASLR